MKDPPRAEDSRTDAASTVLVLFGSFGNLATTKLTPAIARLRQSGLLPRGFVVFGVDRRPPDRNLPAWFHPIQADLGQPDTFKLLTNSIERIVDMEASNMLFYLATRPQLFPEVISGLQREGLNRETSGWRRIAVEKPLGLDLGSSLKLERRLRSAFGREQIFRVDHFLFKEGALGILRFRSGGLLESEWNRRFIDHVQIMADESVGVDGRGAFYDSVGAVRDMVQNHLVQVLCLVATELSPSQVVESAGPAKAKVLEAIAPISADDAVWGQYRGYGRVDGVRRGSRTPTFAALKLSIRNGRWRGVPFYLRTGKRLGRDATEVVVSFKVRPHRSGEGRDAAPGSVRFCIDPKAHVILGEDPPGGALQRSRRESALDEHGRVILGALRGDQSLFVDQRFNELSWRLFDPLLRSFGRRRPEAYEPGSWGPASSDRLVSVFGRRWLDGRSQAELPPSALP